VDVAQSAKARHVEALRRYNADFDESVDFDEPDRAGM
jgi:hypothetical protein